MSEENVELVRAAFAAYAAGDAERFAGFFADDTMMTAPEGWPETGPFEGKEAVLRQFDRLAADWQSHHTSGLTVVADERDWVVVEYRWHTRGAASSVESAVDMASAHRIEKGRAVEGHYRWNRDDALEAAGLSE